MTRQIIFRVLLFAALTPATLRAQAKPTAPPDLPHTSRYLATPPLNFVALLPPPPAPGTPAAEADLLAVHEAEASRTPKQAAQAKLDDQTESIFIYTDVVGPYLQLSGLPLTAALSQHLRAESGVVNPALKTTFHRARPFLADTSLHPICDASKSDSYPSGHAMVGYLEAFALAQMLPEQSEGILQRADRYAHNRVICGVHYPSDVEASRTIALALFGALSTSGGFREEIAAAKAELRAKLIPSR